jgi:hypothetical protein
MYAVGALSLLVRFRGVSKYLQHLAKTKREQKMQTLNLLRHLVSYRRFERCENSRAKLLLELRVPEKLDPSYNSLDGQSNINVISYPKLLLLFTAASR